MFVKFNFIRKLGTTYVVFIYGMRTNAALQVGARCTLEIACFTIISFLSTERECECVSSDYHSLQTEHRMFHIYKVYLQCEYECVYPMNHYLQIGHRMFHIDKVSLQCEYECVN